MDLFEKYQTFVAGLIGFLGVMATIKANSEQNRAQLREERKQESSALRCTLIEELRLISGSNTLNIEGLSNRKVYPIAYIPSTPHIQAFKQLVPKFGLLNANEIKKTMLAYQLIQELPDRLRFLQTMDQSVHIENFIAIDESQCNNAVEVFDSMLSPVLQAIEILECYDKP
ncbi:hypothetical protein [Vibrio splendidus]|uniref:hypothetical protein n=1 Tax=Vibrio splendidus TaxID=29497 RepID=UPI00076AC70C|nr:hypothetical protein [Vibrio splendidus]PHX05459.1 hypothetical protein VSPL_28530 [Vibrio splendidus]